MIGEVSGHEVNRLSLFLVLSLEAINSQTGCSFHRSTIDDLVVMPLFLLLGREGQEKTEQNKGTTRITTARQPGKENER